MHPDLFSHLGPLTEIEFWKEKCNNLESLFDQMQSETTQQMASILNSTNSAYYPSFQNMMSKVVAALKESLDISLYLEPLIEQFEVKSSLGFYYENNLYHQVLESTDFVDMRPLIPPLMHSICLVYSHSKYYNTTSRIIVLMQVIGASFYDLFVSFSNRKFVIS